MQRILIIGCGGSGKSTLARQLGERTGLPVWHLDRLFWRSGWVNIPEEDFDRRLTEVLDQPRWVIDGNYDRTLPLRLSRCDTVVYLDYSRITCLYGIARRVLANRGRTRPDMAEGCPERADWEFLRWVWGYRKAKRPHNLTLLAEAQSGDVAVLRFTNRRRCRAWLHSLALVKGSDTSVDKPA